MSQESKPEKPVEYSSLSEAIPAYVRSCYLGRERKCDKHYSWDPDKLKLVPYSQDYTVSVHIRPSMDSEYLWVEGSGQEVDLNGLKFKHKSTLIFDVEVSTKDNVFAEKFEIPLYTYDVHGWKNEKQAWAIAHSTILRYGLNKLTDWVVFPHFFKDKKAKWDRMLIVAIPKADINKIDKWFNEKLAELAGAKVQIPTAVSKTKEAEEEISVEELEKMLQEIGKGKETVAVVPPTAPTAVTQATLPPLPPTPSRSELVKIYDLIMRLPSKYLVQQSKYVKTETGGVVEQRVWEGLAQQVASRLEGIRRTAYDKIKQLGSFAHVKEFERWIGVTDKAVKDAEELSRWVREELGKLPLKQLRPDLDIDKLYTVKAIEVYLKPEDAKLLLETAIAELEEAREELERRIREAEQEKKRSAIKKLEQELEYTKQVLEQFKKFLQQLETRSATIEQTATQQQQGQKKQRKAVAVTA
jgi:hypothetical protein